MFAPAERRCLVVLSHPNHEAAIFGLMQRLRPTVVILTDGGGAQRVAQSRRGLERIGLLERTAFLGWREADFYGALLDRNVDFFRAVASRLRREIEAGEPEQVLCDAVEFYNPVHDLSLPIVRAALAGDDDIAVFEAPSHHDRLHGQHARCRRDGSRVRTRARAGGGPATPGLPPGPLPGLGVGG